MSVPRLYYKRNLLVGYLRGASAIQFSLSGDLLVKNDMKLERFVRSHWLLHRKAFLESIVEARFFCNFWSINIILLLGQQLSEPLDGRTK